MELHVHVHIYIYIYQSTCMYKLCKLYWGTCTCICILQVQGTCIQAALRYMYMYIWPWANDYWTIPFQFFLYYHQFLHHLSSFSLLLHHLHYPLLSLMKIPCNCMCIHNGYMYLIVLLWQHIMISKKCKCNLVPFLDNNSVAIVTLMWLILHLINSRCRPVVRVYPSNSSSSSSSSYSSLFLRFFFPLVTPLFLLLYVPPGS